MRVHYSLSILVILLPASLAFSQDRRVVTEPAIPRICLTLHSVLSSRKRTIEEKNEGNTDTDRIQKAIDSCSPGTAVEL
ncbi:MAG: glycoside hydrolase, partial [Blastocatellia bacterium]